MPLPKQIISLFLAFIVLSSAIPVFLGEDVTRDNTVDLDDAILLTQRLRDTSENSSAFNLVFHQTISAMRIAASLQSAIKSTEKSSLAEKLNLSDLLYIIPSSFLNHIFFAAASVHPDGCIFQSNDLAPPCPPPRFV